jgi:hypothetical protein
MLADSGLVAVHLYTQDEAAMLTSDTFGGFQSSKGCSAEPAKSDTEDGLAGLAGM